MEQPAIRIVKRFVWQWRWMKKNQDKQPFWSSGVKKCSECKCICLSLGPLCTYCLYNAEPLQCRICRHEIYEGRCDCRPDCDDYHYEYEDYY